MTKYAIVVTTINHPTKAIQVIASEAPRLNAEFYVIGDTKSPPDFSLNGAIYLNVEQQISTGLAYAKQALVRHYARKNIGYLLAIKQGSDVIIETDDDNSPYNEFWLPREQLMQADLVKGQGWCNVYRYFSEATIWPRGLPLPVIQQDKMPLHEASEQIDAPIQQGLADLNPDVDAIYRLVLPLPVSFSRRAPVSLDYGVWCPFNSQNTTWHKVAFPLLYLPAHCSFRMTDIWRSFVAQRIAWENGWRLVFHNATVFQERNDHNLMKDFEDEISGYLRNDEIKKTLSGLSLKGGQTNIPDDLVTCYQSLIGLGVVGKEESTLLNAWLNDLS